MEGSERACPTQDRHGKTEQLSPPDQRSSDRSMRMRSSERDSRAFPLPMHKMDDIPNGDVTMYSYTQKQHIFLPASTGSIVIGSYPPRRSDSEQSSFRSCRRR